MLDFSGVIKLLNNSTVTGVAGFVAGFIAKMIGERLFGEFYTKRQLKLSVYRELAQNYQRIQSELENIAIFGPRAALDVTLATDAYDNAKTQIVLYSTIHDHHYFDRCYEQFKNYQKAAKPSAEADMRLKLAGHSVEEPICGNPELLRKFLFPKYRNRIHH